MTRRVVITGLGTVNALADTVPAFWDALLAGRSGIGPIELFDTSAFKVQFGGEVKDFDPETIAARRNRPGAWIASPSSAWVPPSPPSRTAASISAGKTPSAAASSSAAASAA